MKKMLPLALALALCLSLAAPALAAESPKISWLPEELHPWRNPEIDELEAPLTSELVLVFTGTFNPQWGSWDHQKFGLADKTGKLVVPVEYESVSVLTDELYEASKDRKTYLIDSSGQIIRSMDYYLGRSAGEGLITAYSYGREPDYIYKYGFVDTTGKLVVPLVYDSVSEFSEGLARVSNGEWGSAEYAFVDKTGRVVLDLGAQYQYVGSFSEGLAVVSDRNNKYGAIDRSGQLVIPMEYDWLNDFSGGLAVAGKRVGTDALDYPIYEMGFIDKTGAVVIPFEYSWADDFSDGLARVGIRSGYEMAEFGGYEPAYKYGLIDPSGKIVVPLIYDSISFEWGNTGTNRNSAVVCKGGKCDLIDRTGNIVVPLEYDGYDSAYYGYFANGVVQLYKGDWETGKSYVMDSSGNIVIPPEYDFKWRSPKYGEPGVFFNDIAAVGKDGKWGYMDRNGKILLPLEYDEVGYASGGIGVVRQGSRYGIVDLNASAQPAGVTAMPTNDSLLRDGVPQNPTVYKINGSNYFKVRDLAAILNGTGKQFDVGYDQAAQSVTVFPGGGYTKLDTDLAGAPAGGNKTAQPSNDTIYINGVKIDADVYKIDGSNYFKLRDLGRALNFYVGWDNSTKTVALDTTKGYGDGENDLAAMAQAMLDILNQEMSHGACLVDTDGDSVKELMVLGKYAAQLYDWNNGQLSAKNVGMLAGGQLDWWLCKDTLTGELGIEFRTVGDSYETSVFYYPSREFSIGFTFSHNYLGSKDYQSFSVGGREVSRAEYSAVRQQNWQQSLLLDDMGYIYSPNSIIKIRAELECLLAGKTIQNISDEGLLVIAEELLSMSNGLSIGIANAGFVQYDNSDTIMEGGSYGGRVIGYTTIAQVEAAANELWYQTFSRRTPGIDEDSLDLMRQQFVEQNGKLYYLALGVGDEGFGTELDRMISRTDGEAVFAANFHYWIEEEEIIPYQFSLVFEDGSWKYLEH